MINMLPLENRDFGIGPWTRIMEVWLCSLASRLNRPKTAVEKKCYSDRPSLPVESGDKTQEIRTSGILRCGDKTRSFQDSQEDAGTLLGFLEASGELVSGRALMRDQGGILEMLSRAVIPHPHTPSSHPPPRQPNPFTRVVTPWTPVHPVNIGSVRTH